MLFCVSIIYSFLFLSSVPLHFLYPFICFACFVLVWFFYLFWVMNAAAMNVQVHAFIQTLFVYLFHFSQIPGSGIAGSWSSYLTSWGTARVFYYMYHFYILTGSVWEVQLLPNPGNTAIVRLLNFSDFMLHRYISLWLIFMIFWQMIWSTYSSTYWPFLYLLWNIIRFLAHFLIGLFLCTGNCKNALCILNYSP